jgi:hypothetical protein
MGLTGSSFCKGKVFIKWEDNLQHFLFSLLPFLLVTSPSTFAALFRKPLPCIVSNIKMYVAEIPSDDMNRPDVA